MASVEHWPYQRLFQKWRVFILVIQFFIVILWMCIFLPDAVVNWLAARFAMAEGGAGGLRQILQGLLPLGGGAVGLLLLLHFANFVINDVLLSQHTRAAQYFRGEFPSIKIAAQFNLVSEDARKVWHDYYDTWQFTTSPHFQRYKETTRAGFVCRSVHISTYLLWILSIIGVIIVAANSYLKGADGFWGQYCALVILLGAAFVITALNRVPRGNRPPTGCWKLWRDRCTENLAAFQSDLNGQGGDLSVFRRLLADNLRKLNETAQTANISWLTVWTG